MSGQARDIKLSTQRIEGYRNFGTKLWNAARFCQANGCERVEGFDPAGVTQTINRWIRGETARAAREVTAALEACAFDDVANGLYRFIWNIVCDWYIELAKPILNGADEAAKAETRAMAAWVLDVVLKLLHPVMPFITEELWDKLGETGPAREGMLIVEAWPVFADSYADDEAAADIGWLMGLVDEIRSIRAEMNVPPAARPPLTLSGAERGQPRAAGPPPRPDPDPGAAGERGRGADARRPGAVPVRGSARRRRRWRSPSSSTWQPSGRTTPRQGDQGVLERRYRPSTASRARQRRLRRPRAGRGGRREGSPAAEPIGRLPRPTRNSPGQARGGGLTTPRRADIALVERGLMQAAPGSGGHRRGERDGGWCDGHQGLGIDCRRGCARC